MIFKQFLIEKRCRPSGALGGGGCLPCYKGFAPTELFGGACYGAVINAFLPSSVFGLPSSLPYRCIVTLSH